MKRGCAHAERVTLQRFGWNRMDKPEGRNPRPERRPKPEDRKQQLPRDENGSLIQRTVAWRPLPPQTAHLRTCGWPLRISDFGLLSAFGLRVSDFSTPCLPYWKRRGTSVILRFVLMFLASSAVCFGQGHVEPRPAPLDPVQAEQEARALVADLLAQRPDQNTTNTGQVRIRDGAGKEREIPVQFEITATPTNWASVYETLTPAGGPGGEKLTVIHASGQPNQYQLVGLAGTSKAVPKELTPEQTMIPFAGSDFWVADLGLEFLHWPKQRLLKKEMRHSKSCEVLESVNPQPVPGGCARVVSWIMIESPHGIIHADAYDAQGQILKRFDPANVEKIQGEYQLEEVEMRNPKTGSRTWIKFNLSHE